MRNERRVIESASHRAEDQGNVSKYRAVIFVSAVLAYTIYTIEKNAIIEPSHWLSLASQSVGQFSCFAARGKKLRLACNVALSVVCLSVFLAALYALVKKYYRRQHPSAEELNDWTASPSRSGYVKRISPKEFEAQGESYTRRQIKKLVGSPDYRELKRLKGDGLAHWNWQADPSRNTEDVSEEEEEAPRREDDSPLPKRKGPFDIGASPATMSSPKKKLF